MVSANLHLIVANWHSVVKGANAPLSVPPCSKNPEWILDFCSLRRPANSANLLQKNALRAIF